MPTKSVVRAVRYTPEEWQAIQRKAAKAELPPATFIRRAALRRKVTSKTTTQAIAALNKIGVNLNQLTRIANTKGRLPREIADCLEQLRTVLMDLYKS